MNLVSQIFDMHAHLVAVELGESDLVVIKYATPAAFCLGDLYKPNLAYIIG